MTHAPKLAALLAYDAGALSDAGKARVERHLERCSSCRRALAELRAFEQVAAEVRAVPVPLHRPDEEAWQRLSRAVAPPKPPRVRLLPWVGSGLVALAAAAVLVWSVQPPAPAAPRAQTVPPQTVEVPPVIVASAAVTAVSGEVRDGARVLAVGDEVREGTSLAASISSRAHLRLGEGTGIVLAAESALKLASLAPGAVTLELEEGTVVSQVAPLGPGGRFEVIAGAYVVRVHGTRFSVTRVGSAVAVRLDEGVVELTKDGQSIATLRAPAAWSSDERAVTPAFEQGSVPRPVALEPAALAWPVLRLPRFEGLTRWSIGEVELDAQAAAAVRVSPGALEVRAFDAAGHALQATLEVRGDGSELAFDPRELEPVRPVVSPVRTGTLSVAELQPTVRAGLPALRQCYELETRRNPSFVARVSVHIVVGVDGEVEGVRTTGEGAPVLAPCLEQRVRGWIFPAPHGGRMSFDVPVSFTASRH